MSKLDDVAGLLATEGISSGAARQDQDKGAGDNQGEDQDQGAGDDQGEDQNQGAGDDQGEDQDQAPAAVKLADIAEKLGIPAAELYDQVEIPMGGDKVLTLGEVKDLATQTKKALGDLANVQETADNQNREMMLERQELYKAAELLAPQLTAKAQAQLDALKSATNAREIKLLLAALPTWKNQETAKKELGRMEKLAARYGISPSELEVLAQDHRLVRLLRDKSTDEAGNKPTPKPGGRTHGRKVTDAYNRAKADGATKADKLQGIASLLN